MSVDQLEVRSQPGCGPDTGKTADDTEPLTEEEGSGSSQPASEEEDLIGYYYVGEERKHPCSSCLLESVASLLYC